MIYAKIKMPVKQKIIAMDQGVNFESNCPGQTKSDAWYGSRHNMAACSGAFLPRRESFWLAFERKPVNE